MAQQSGLWLPFAVTKMGRQDQAGPCPGFTAPSGDALPSRAHPGELLQPVRGPKTPPGIAISQARPLRRGGQTAERLLQAYGAVL